MFEDDLYRRCKTYRLASGYIVTNGKVKCFWDHSRCPSGAIGFDNKGEPICLGGGEQTGGAGPAADKTAEKVTGSNKRVNDHLNDADQAPNRKIKCGYVALAARRANLEGADNQQKAEIRKYAQQCDLRF